MLSFIVIGRNEGEKLRCCFNSIIKTIHQNELTDAEIIYVDSNSDDNSIEIALSFPEVKVIKLTLYYNAAIGRNIGVMESKGDIFFFIDGDMEIIPDFIPEVLNENGLLKYRFVSGNHIGVYYDINGNLIEEKLYGIGNLNKDQYFYETGGIFLIDRELWLSVNGLKNRFMKSQDVDLALRLAKRGTLLLRKKDVINKHHTVAYSNPYRMWSELFSTKYFYSNGLLIREHIFNKYMYKRLIKHNPTFLVLFAALFFSLATFNPLFLLVHPLATTGRTLFSRYKSLHRIFYFFLRDYITLYSFLFFYPAEKKTNEIPYIICNE